MRTFHAGLAAVLLAGALPGCIPPSDGRPGLWLTGEEAPWPEDWRFTEAHREIALEVRAPYGLPHSVTIWCVAPGGELHVAARDPDEKRWPAWADDRPDVRLRIDGRLYEARLERIDDAAALAPVREAYAQKYQLERPATPAAGPPMRYWRVGPRG